MTYTFIIIVNIVTCFFIIANIIHKEDKRLLIIVGPCSIHNEEAALDYAKKLMKLKKDVLLYRVSTMRPKNLSK